MKRVLARSVAVAALVLSVSSIAGGGLLLFAADDRIDRERIVVVGDRSAPGMQDVIEELESRVRRGEDVPSAGGGGTVAIVLVIVLLLVWVGIGVLIVFRQPAHWAGWLFLITGAPLPLLSLAQALMVYEFKVERGSVPFVTVWAVLGEFALYPLALVPLLFLLYPDGHLPSRRWRWPVIGLVGGTAVAFVAFLLRPGPFNNWREDGIVFENPFGVDAFADVAGVVISAGTIVALVSALAAVSALVLRFRRSTGETRQQMRLLAFVGAIAGTFVVLMFTLGFVAEAVTGGGGEKELAIFPIMFGLAVFTVVVGVPISYLVAIFRYRLLDLDLVIRKAVVFGLVAAGITALAMVVVVLIPIALVGTGLSGWEYGLLAFGIALGWLIGPIRRVARRVADRIVYRSRATPYEVLTAFSERVGETYSIDDVLPRMVQVLASATGATSARVLLRVGDGMREVARWPEGVEAPGEEHTVPVEHLGEELGELAVTMPPNDPMDASKERLMRDLASQAGLVLRNVRLIEEVRASRKRIVTAQDERARKLERDLHDGAQQQLVALTVKLRLLQQVAERDPTKAGQLADQVQEDAQRALDDLRDLARGIYPPLLADKGLPEAVSAQARRSPVPVTVETDSVGRYARDVESAVYFCTLEALNNVAKYADATRAVVRLAQSNGQLTFTVSDDGCGFDPRSTAAGTGLQGMVDRIEAIGGAFDVVSAPGSGTTVIGRIPLGG